MSIKTKYDSCCSFRVDCGESCMKRLLQLSVWPVGILVSVLSKVFATALLSKLESVFETSDYQFGFKSHHSTDLCIIR